MTSHLDVRKERGALNSTVMFNTKAIKHTQQNAKVILRSFAESIIPFSSRIFFILS